MCNSVLIKSAVQKTAVGGAKNGGRGLEKKTLPQFFRVIYPSTNLTVLM